MVKKSTVAAVVATAVVTLSVVAVGVTGRKLVSDNASNSGAIISELETEVTTETVEEVVEENIPNTELVAEEEPKVPEEETEEVETEEPETEVKVTTNKKPAPKASSNKSKATKPTTPATGIEVAGNTNPPIYIPITNNPSIDVPSKDIQGDKEEQPNPPSAEEEVPEVPEAPEEPEEPEEPEQPKEPIEIDTSTWKFDKVVVPYDGNEHAAVVVGLPDWVTPVYRDNVRTEVGTNNAYVSFIVPEGYKVPAEMVTEITIEKASFAPITITPDDLVEVGNGDFRIAIPSDRLPEGVTCTYFINGAPVADDYVLSGTGVYVVKVQFTVADTEHYNEIEDLEVLYNVKEENTKPVTTYELTLKPSEAQVNEGEAKVDIYLNSVYSSPQGMQAVLNFDKDALEFKGIELNEEAWDHCVYREETGYLYVTPVFASGLTRVGTITFGIKDFTQKFSTVSITSIQVIGRDWNMYSADDAEGVASSLLQHVVYLPSTTTFSNTEEVVETCNLEIELAGTENAVIEPAGSASMDSNQAETENIGTEQAEESTETTTEVSEEVVTDGIESESTASKQEETENTETDKAETGNTETSQVEGGNATTKQEENSSTETTPTGSGNTDKEQAETENAEMKQEDMESTPIEAEEKKSEVAEKTGSGSMENGEAGIEKTDTQKTEDTVSIQ